MNVFFACTGKKEPIYITESGFKNILCSYHYYKNDKATLEQVKNLGGRIFIDSGAFSAHNAGAEVDINAYSKFLEEIQPEICVSLDVIGNAQATMDNWIYQNKNFNVNCIPTYHMGEPLEFLDEYMHQCDYIALGGMVGSKNIEIWLDKVWTYILKNKPDLKVHGFGMTITDYIYKYPWYSFDSSSFKSGKRFGRVPHFNGKKLYNETIKKWALGIQNDHPDIFENKQKQQRLADLQGCKAYDDLVKYLTTFEKSLEFSNQTSLF